MPRQQTRYISVEYTDEELVAVLSSFSPEQVQLFEHLMCAEMEQKAALEYNAESPIAVVRASGYHGGKIELLNLLLEYSTTSRSA